jgi:hypothetical protein
VGDIFACSAEVSRADLGFSNCRRLVIAFSTAADFFLVVYPFPLLPLFLFLHLVLFAYCFELLAELHTLFFSLLNFLQHSRHARILAKVGLRSHVVILFTNSTDLCGSLTLTGHWPIS